MIFRGGEDLAGYWKGIAIATASADNSFEHTVLRNGGSLDWYGGGDAAATIYLAHGSASLANVTFESGEGFALVVRSEATVSCTNVDVAGLGHREWVGLDLVDHATCPP